MVFVKILDMEPYVWKQLSITIWMYLGNLMLGYGVSWSAPMMPKLMNPEETPLPYVVAESRVSLVVMIMYMGSWGGFIIGYLSNRIGRKRTMIVGSIVILFSYILITWPLNFAMLLAGRWMSGFGMCFFAIVNMIYIGEIATPKIRGILLTLTGVFHALGGVFMYSLGAYVSYRGCGYVGIAMSLLRLFGNLCIPESPVYHIIKGEEEKARDVLKKLGRDKNIETEMKLMLDHVENSSKKAKLSEIFTVKSNRKAFIILMVLFTIQESNGMGAVIFFSTTIFTNSGSYIPPHLATIIIGLTAFFGTIVAPVFVDKCGRKVLLVISNGFCFIAMTALGVYFYLDLIKHPSIQFIGWLPLTSLVVSLFTFSIGVSIIPNTLLGELFSPKLRGIGSSLTMTVGYLVGLLFSATFGYMVAAMGSHTTFWLYAFINLLAVFFTIFWVPETKGKSLSEIDEMLARKKRLRMERIRRAQEYREII